MKQLIHMLVVTTVVLNSVICLPAWAGIVKFKTSGERRNALITADAETRRVGNVSLPGSSKVVITNNVVDVLLAKADLTSKDKPPETAFRGTAFCVTAKASGTSAKIGGFVFFDKGTQVSDLDLAGVPDTVRLEDGTVCSGKIEHVGGQELSMRTDAGTRTFDTSRIEDISSPRVNRFQMNTRSDQSIGDNDSFEGTSRTITFTPTCSQKASRQAGGKEPMPAARKAAIFLVAGVLLATAIAVPLAVAIPLANRRRSSPMPFLAPAAPAAAVPDAPAAVGDPLAP